MTHAPGAVVLSSHPLAPTRDAVLLETGGGGMPTGALGDGCLDRVGPRVLRPQR